MTSRPDNPTSRELEKLATRAVDDVAIRRVREQLVGWAQAETNRRWLELSKPRRWGIAVAVAGAVAVACLFGLLAMSRVRPTIDETPPQTSLATVRDSSISSVEADNAKWQTALDEAIERIDLSDGTLRLHVHRKPGGKRVIVRTPDGEIEDLGTVFHVVVRDGSTSAIGVDEGIVTVRVRDIAPFTLTAGESWQRTPEPTAIEPKSPQAPQPRASRPARPHVVTSAPPAPSDEPADAVREDAAYLEILQMLRDGQRAHARALAEAYLRNFPQGFRRTEVEHVAHE